MAEESIEPGGTATSDKPTMLKEMQELGVSEDALEAFEHSVPQSEFSQMRNADRLAVSQAQQTNAALLQQLQARAESSAQPKSNVDEFMASQLSDDSEGDAATKHVLLGLSDAIKKDLAGANQASNDALQRQIQGQSIDAALNTERGRLNDIYGKSFVDKVWGQVAQFTKSEITNGRQATPETVILGNFGDEALNARTRIKTNATKKAADAQKAKASGGFEQPSNARELTQKSEPDPRRKWQDARNDVAASVQAGLAAIGLSSA